MPCDSSSWRVMGCEGLKWPSRPSVQSPGISQMRKKPSMWSIRYAWKYLDTDRAMSYEVALFFGLMVQSILKFLQQHRIWIVECRFCCGTGSKAAL